MSIAPREPHSGEEGDDCVAAVDRHGLGSSNAPHRSKGNWRSKTSTQPHEDRRFFFPLQVVGRRVLWSTGRPALPVWPARGAASAEAARASRGCRCAAGGSDEGGNADLGASCGLFRQLELKDENEMYSQCTMLFHSRDNRWVARGFGDTGLLKHKKMALCVLCCVPRIRGRLREVSMSRIGVRALPIEATRWQCKGLRLDVLRLFRRKAKV